MHCCQTSTRPMLSYTAFMFSSLFILMFITNTTTQKKHITLLSGCIVYLDKEHIKINNNTYIFFLMFCFEEKKPKWNEKI